MWSIVGHRSAVELLRRSIESGRVGHAYLFSGPDHVGKRTLALQFARALVCTGDDPPCGPPVDAPSSCRACRHIHRGIHPDFREIELRTGKWRISSEQVDQFQHDLALKPMEAQRKVYLITDASLLSSTAANQLLKTLEEPPPQVVLILTADSPDLLLPTIVSRCQLVPLRPLPVSQVADYLKRELGQDPERAQLLARLSGGRIGWAISASQDPAILSFRERALEMLDSIARGSRLDRLARSRELAERWTTGPDSVREMLRLWTGWWRDVLLVQLGQSSEVANCDRLSSIQAVARTLHPHAVTGAIDALRRTSDYLEHNCNPRLTLDVLALQIPAL